MALSVSSILHYWSARYGPTPIIGGRPVHTRSSAARIADQRGILHAPITNTPRIGWDTIDGERRPTLTLEMARTNQLLYSEDFSNAAWTKTGTGASPAPIVTANTAIAPDGNLTADTIAFGGVAGADLSFIIQTGAAASGSNAYTGSVWLRASTARTIQIRIDDSVSAGSTLVACAVTTEWQRFTITHTFSAAAGNARFAIWQDSGSTTSAFSLFAWGAQLEAQTTFATSYVPTTSAVATRTADSFYWDFPPAPQQMGFYTRHVERGTIATSAGRLWQIGASAHTNARLIVFRDTASGCYAILHQTAAGSVQATLAAAPAVGQTVELSGYIDVNGSVRISQSVNGAAVTTSTPSGDRALVSAWSDTRLWLNSVGTTGIGSNRFAEMKLVKLADVVAATPQDRMNELRAFEVNSAGEVLA